MPLGALIIGLHGLELTAVERELLRHPLVGGVILFQRNYDNPEQIAALNATIHALREPRLLITVDHEGGRVQRFRAGFTKLPAMRRIGQLHDRSPWQALQAATFCGWLLAAELRAVGVDLSFAPVLDLDYAVNPAIGDRALHRDPEAVVKLAQALLRGLRRAGMAAVGKHFPGHGGVKTDSHLEIPVDPRRYSDLVDADLLTFERLIRRGLPAIMPAHVIYPAVDNRPAGFSPVWLQTVLRQHLRFAGTIISDDLDMAGAGWAGGPAERAAAALDAGCDMILACNDPAAVTTILDSLTVTPDPAAEARRRRLCGRGTESGLAMLTQQPTWHRARRRLAEFLGESDA